MNRQVTKRALKLDGDKIISIATVGAIGALIVGVAASRSCNKAKENTTNSEVSTTATSTFEATSATTTASTSSTTSINYDLETVKVNYSSPTRDSNETNNEGFVTNEYGDSPDVTYEVIRETTPYDYVEVIEEPTIPTTESFAETAEKIEETTVPTKETDINGTVAETTTYIAPEGNDELPIEPTKVTIDISKLNRKVLVLKK